jgi:hypothetical protein
MRAEFQIDQIPGSERSSGETAPHVVETKADNKIEEI